jgi:hypothetical protein
MSRKNLGSAAVILFLFLSACGGTMRPYPEASTVGAAEGDRQAVAGRAGITRLDDLTRAGAGGALDGVVGRQVELRNVRVESAPGPDVFWLGQAGSRVLVLAEPGGNHTFAQPGQEVNVSGVVQRMPDAEQAPDLWTAIGTEGERPALFVRAQSVSAAR